MRSSSLRLVFLLSIRLPLRTDMSALAAAVCWVQPRSLHSCIFVLVLNLFVFPALGRLFIGVNGRCLVSFFGTQLLRLIALNCRLADSYLIVVFMILFQRSECLSLRGLFNCRSIFRVINR